MARMPASGVRRSWLIQATRSRRDCSSACSRCCACASRSRAPWISESMSTSSRRVGARMLPPGQVTQPPGLAAHALDVGHDPPSRQPGHQQRHQRGDRRHRQDDGEVVGGDEHGLGRAHHPRHHRHHRQQRQCHQGPPHRGPAPQPHRERPHHGHRPGVEQGQSQYLQGRLTHDRRPDAAGLTTNPRPSGNRRPRPSPGAAGPRDRPRPSRAAGARGRSRSRCRRTPSPTPRASAARG